MGLIRKPLPVKLFCGILSSEPAIINESTDLINAVYGPIDFETEVLPWDTTDYYRDEMGTDILRKFLFFKKLIAPDCLAAVKVFTNDIEERLADRTPSGLRRRVNLDPGYVTEAKVVLATTKDFSHRVYIGENIYAEATLRYSNKEKSFVSCDHTYFDFRTEQYKTMFNTARTMLREALDRRKLK
jgi:hypothetical protein